jgi:nitroreductase
MRTTGTCRYYTDDPVPDELLMQAFDVARFAPTGGNQQPVSWVVVRDPELRRAPKELYDAPWQSLVKGVLAGCSPCRRHGQGLG